MEGKALHDRLLEEMPAGATHPMASCKFCLADALDEGAPNGGAPTVTTYSQEELDRAVAAATTELTAKVTTLEAAQATSAIDAKIAEAVAEKDTALADLQTTLDNTTLERDKARSDLADMNTYLASEVETARLKAEADARKDGRLAEVAELKLPQAFVDGVVTPGADRFAAMTDDEWTARKAEWAALAGGTGDGVPANTGGSGLTGARETADLHTRQNTPTSAASVMGSLRELASAGVDPRTIH